MTLQRFWKWALWLTPRPVVLFSVLLLLPMFAAQCYWPRLGGGGWISVWAFLGADGGAYALTLLIWPRILARHPEYGARGYDRFSDVTDCAVYLVFAFSLESVIRSFVFRCLLAFVISRVSLRLGYRVRTAWRSHRTACP